jgi:hypothetical protein
LSLPPWMYPPALIDDADIEKILAAGDDVHGKFVAAKLVMRLRELSISQFHPDPMAALAQIENKPAA